MGTLPLTSSQLVEFEEKLNDLLEAEQLFNDFHEKYHQDIEKKESLEEEIEIFEFDLFSEKDIFSSYYDWLWTRQFKIQIVL